MNMLSIAALIFVFIALVVAYGCNIVNRWKYRHVPGPPLTLFFGNLLQLVKSGGLHKFLPDCAQKYGPVFMFYLGRSPFICISDPEMVKDIGVKSFAKFHDRGQSLNPNTADKGSEAQRLDACGTVVAKGKYWAGLRAACEPLFHTAALRSYAPIIGRSAATLVGRLDARASAGESANVNQMFGNMTLEVIGAAGFGVDFDAQGEKDNDLVLATRTVFKPAPPSILTLLALAIPPLKYLIWLVRSSDEHLLQNRASTGYLFGTCQALLATAKQARAKELGGDAVDAPAGNGHHDEAAKASAGLRAMSSLARQLYDKWEASKARAAQHFAGRVPEGHSLLWKLVGVQHRDEGRPLRDIEIISQATTFMLAGFETTSAALAFTLWEVARSPGIQARLQQEVDAFGDRAPGFDDLDKFPYTEAVFNESMRMYPPVTPLIALKRANSHEAATVGGIHIPRGSEVFLNVGALHHDPANFPEPQEFRPERFLKGHPEGFKHHPYSYIPFGVGPRKCIGYKLAMEEAVMALVQLLQRFSFSVDETRHLTPNLELQATVTLFPKDGIWLRTHPRKNRAL